MITRFEQMALGLMVVRLTLGSVFILHGGQKVFGWFGGPGPEGFVSWLATLHVPAFLGYAAAYMEFLSGILLFFGIAAELGALMAIAMMIGAIILVHGPHGYFGQNNGFEYPLNLALFALAIIIGGPGKGALWDPFITLRDRLFS
jgi:putative oxidoreductase